MFSLLETEKTEVKKEEETSETETKVSVKEEEPSEEKPEILSLQGIVKEELAELQRENRRLHNTATYLHQRHHEHTLEVIVHCKKKKLYLSEYKIFIQIFQPIFPLIMCFLSESLDENSHR